jgi:hypothetical protein
VTIKNNALAVAAVDEAVAVRLEMSPAKIPLTKME